VKLSPPLESDEARTLCHYLDLRGICYCHVPNESRHRRHGVKAGVPDLLIFDYGGRPNCRGVAIELKRISGGKLTDEQENWILRLRARGWLVFVCKGAAAAIKVIEELWPLDEGRRG